MPLFLDERQSARARRWLGDDSDVVTWIWTHAEAVSAIERCVRQGLLSREERRSAWNRLDNLASDWDEITDALAVRSRAISLLARHPLRATDAGQLGAALLVQDQMAGPLTFVSLDRNLVLAAEREGLRVLDDDGG